MTENDLGLKTTAAEGSIRFDELTAGNYTLTEEVVPTGYVNNNLAIRLKVTKLESGFKVELVGDYTGVAKIDQNVLTIVNKKPGEDTPVNPPSPVIPPVPVNPTVPVYPPSPENPGKPSNHGKTVDVDKDKTPKGDNPADGGKKTPAKPGNKPNKDNGIKVIDDKTPQGGNKQRLPRTGGTNTGLYYGAGAGLLLLAGFAVVRSRKKEQ